MRKFETLTGPSGASELVLPVHQLQVGDAWMGSTVLEIRELWEGGNFLIVWLSRDGSKNASVAAKYSYYQKIYLELAPDPWAIYPHERGFIVLRGDKGEALTNDGSNEIAFDAGRRDCFFTTQEKAQAAIDAFTADRGKPGAR